MLRARTCGLLAAAFLAGSGARAAECRVTDPTGTPLNVRSGPNGRVVGTLVNGQRVSVLDRRIEGGKPWVYLGDRELGDQPIGWVFRDFVSCY